MSILSVKDLAISFPVKGQYCPAVMGVSFDVRQDETLCIVGESGCGKSITAFSMIGLLDESARVSGQILFGGRNLLDLNEREWQKVRGGKIGMIFQEPMTSLNPVLTVGEQISEPLMDHLGMGEAEALREARTLLDLVRIPDAATRLGHYPHQMSGGMRQRVMIAMGLACKPQLLIADEPTTALDVTIQAQVLSLLADVRRERQFSLVLITHDLGVVANVADRVAVMYAGQMVETGDVNTIFSNPLHPYTQALLKCVPRADVRQDLVPIDGQVPAISNMPGGCRFAPRCAEAGAICEGLPELKGEAHKVRCWRREDMS